MAVPSWFDEYTYLQSKLNQLISAGQTQYSNVTQVKAAIEAAGMSVYQHFEKFSLAERTSPNTYFNTQEYLEAKAAQLNTAQGVTTWTADKVALEFQNAGFTNAYEHFSKYGWQEDVNPSNSFDVSSYLEAKAAETGKTVDEVKAAFEAAGLDPIAHYETYGKSEGITVTEVPADEQVTPDSSGSTGQTFTLTTSAETFFGTSGNDTFDATGANTLNIADRLIDQSTTDNDTLNATITNANTGVAPTLINIENVNLDLQVFSGASFDAANTEGATITGSSTKLGFNGKLTVNNAGANTVVAGTNISELTVTGVEGGAINAGSASKVIADGVTADEDALTLTVNGDVAAVLGANAAFDTVTVVATADAEVDLATSNINTGLTVQGASNVTLLTADVLSGLEIVNELTAGELVADVAVTGTNGTDWDVTRVNISADIAAFTAPDAGTVDLAVTQSDLTLTGQSATTGTVTVNTAEDQTKLTFAALKSATLNLSGEVTVGTLDAGTADVTVNVDDDTTITTLTGDTNTITVAGEGDVTVTNGTAGEVDASNLAGALLYTQAANAATTVIGGQGDNVVDLKATDTDVDYTGQSGDDDVTLATTTGNAAVNLAAGGDNTVTATALTSGTLAVTGGAGADEIIVKTTDAATISLELGAGNDVVDITADIHDDTVFAVDFGTGTDTLKVDTDISGVTLNVTGLDVIDIGDGQGAVLAASQLSGKSYTIQGAGTGTTLQVVGTDNADTLDLSGLTFDATITKGVDATNIELGAGKDTVTLSSVADTVVVASGDTGITAATADTIIGFSNADDQLSLTDITGVFGTVVKQDTATSFEDFIAKANAALDGTVKVFAAVVGDDTWVVADYAPTEGSLGTVDAVDSLIRLVGVTDALTADNFDGITASS